MIEPQYCTGSGCDVRQACSLYLNHRKPMTEGKRVYLKVAKTDCKYKEDLQHAEKV